MKATRHHLQIFLHLALAITFLFPATGNAQDCNSAFYQMREGASFTLSSYDGKKKPLSKVVHRYKKVNKTGNGLTAQVQQEIFDSKDKPISKGEYEISCQNGVIKLNIQDLMGSGMNVQNTNIRMEMSGDAMELPSNLAVGQTLKDATLHMKGTLGQTKVMEQQLNMTNRKVEGKETVVTPAGKFESFKISYQTEITGMMGKPVTMKTITWYAKGPGMVKTESYDDKGKLTSYTLLTGYSK